MKKIFVLQIIVALCLCSGAFAEGEDTTAFPKTGELPEWMTVQSPPYDARGKEDPFVPFIRRIKTDDRELPPLQKVDTNAIKVTGILNRNGVPIASVELPDGKAYLVRKGMSVGLFDGVITSIGNEMVVVEENIVDIFGDAKKRSVSLRLRQEKE